MALTIVISLELSWLRVGFIFPLFIVFVVFICSVSDKNQLLAITIDLITFALPSFLPANL